MNIRITYLATIATLTLGLGTNAAAQFCGFQAGIAVSPANQSVAALGGNGQFNVIETIGCGYNPSNDVTWLTFTAFPSSVSFSAAANFDLCQRVGHITVTIPRINASATETIAQAASAGDFSLVVSPASQSTPQGGSVSYSVLINRTGGFSGNVALSPSGLPSGVSASFSNLTASSANMTLTATRTATTGSFPITVSGVNACVQRNAAPVTLNIMPLPWNPADLTVQEGAPIPEAGSALAGHMNTVAVPNVDEVFNFDTNLDVDGGWWNGSWHVTDLTTNAGGPQAVAGSAIVGHINTIANSDEVFNFDANQHVIEWWWNGSWHPADITAAAGSPPAIAGSGLSSHVNTRGNTDEVFFIDTSLNVDGLWWSPSSGWHVTGITSSIGAPTAGSITALTSNFDTVGNVDHVVYLDANQNVDDLWWDGSSWHVTDLTMAAAAPVAAVNSALTSHVNSVAQTNEIFYVGADGSVNLLSWSNFQWQVTRIGALIGAPPAASGTALTGHVDTIDNLDEVVYIGQDQHVNLLWWDGNWHFTDLTTATGAILAAPGSALTSQVNTVARVDEVYYIGTDQHIHEFFR